MTEAKNFIEKELGKSIEQQNNNEKIQESKEHVPIYIPPSPKIQKQEPEPELPQLIEQQPVIQIVEKIVYKKQRIHGFFRTLTIIALLAIGFLMLGESTGIISLSINNFKLHNIFPIAIILSTIIIRSYKGILGKIFGLIIFLTVRGGLFTISVYTSLNPSTKRKEGITIDYELPKEKKINVYFHTLIGNSYIKEGNSEHIKGTRNSDRNLLILSGTNNIINYIQFEEEKNWNLLQKYASKLDIQLPQNKIFTMIYLKNFLGLHTIDLKNIQRKTIKLHGGINDFTIRVANVLSGNKIEIQGAAANVDIQLPKDIGVIVYHKHYIGKLHIVGFKEENTHTFVSENINDAKAILYIFINLGASNTKISRTQ